MHISRLPITAAALFTLAIGPTSLVARPTVPLETPQTCQVVNQQDINNTGRTSAAETLQRLPTSPTDCPPAQSTTSLSAFDQRILDIHNHERALVGAAPLRWSPVLAQHARDYAQVLAELGQLVHADRAGRGIERENLQKGLIGWSPDNFMQNWTREKQRFHYGFFPDVCDGDWSQCAHYSQIIWPTTTEIGCGRAQGGGFDWFVCRYSPGGNKDGRPVGQPRQIASNNAAPVRPPSDMMNTDAIIDGPSTNGNRAYHAALSGHSIFTENTQRRPAQSADQPRSTPSDKSGTEFAMSALDPLGSADNRILQWGLTNANVIYSFLPDALLGNVSGPGAKTTGSPDQDFFNDFIMSIPAPSEPAPLDPFRLIFPPEVM